MQFQDLSPFSYSLPYPPTQRVLNVGWLEPGAAFRQGMVPGLEARLVEYVGHLVDMMLGQHECEFCGQSDLGVVCQGQKFSLGSAQLRVLHKGVWYASPNLIVHYVGQHNYMPPAEYLDAVFQGEPPDSQDYADALYELQKTRPKTPGPLGRLRRRGPDPYLSAKIAAELYGTRPPEPETE